MHSVDMTAGPLPIRRKGVTFVIKEDGFQVAELTVSQGGLRWRPANVPAGAPNDRLLTWSQLKAGAFAR